MAEPGAGIGRQNLDSVVLQAFAPELPAAPVRGFAWPRRCR